jgi:LuxR family transcriptional regulator, maltose regulon positive regulatory protein
MPRSKEIDTKRLYFTERLKQAMGEILNYPLTVVEAPMGYGKTTAVREAFRQDGIIPLWLHVFNNDAESFWNGFSELVGELDSGCGESLIQLGFPSNAVSMNEALKLISRVTLSDPAVIVVDDYHNLDSAELNTYFELLSECGAFGLHIVLTARYTKFRRLEELKLKKIFSILRTKPLHFNHRKSLTTLKFAEYH